MIIGILTTALVAILGMFAAVYLSILFAERSLIEDMVGDKIWHNLFFAARILTFISYLAAIGICVMYFFL